MKTEVANADKASRQDVGEETTDEFEGRQDHDFLLALVAMVEVGEGDGISANCKNTVIGDGNAKDVATEILDQFLGTIERSLDVDLPILGQGMLEHGRDIECAIVGMEFALCPELRELKTKAVAELVGQQ